MRQLISDKGRVLRTLMCGVNLYTGLSYLMNLGSDIELVALPPEAYSVGR